jgi:mRNA export factor
MKYASLVEQTERTRLVLSLHKPTLIPLPPSLPRSSSSPPVIAQNNRPSPQTMSALFGSGTTSSAGSTLVEISQDIEVPQGPEDSISELAFSPTAEILGVSSWDNKVRIYEIGQAGVTGKAMYEHAAPVLTCHFSKDGTKLASGGADKTAKVFDLQSGQNQQVAAHDAPVKGVKFVSVNGTEALATASWDKTLRYWDLRRTSSRPLLCDSP